jgi:malate dehydrogenase (quinone)
LIGQLLESSDKRFDALREFYPNAKEEDWRVEVAGQRVQIIRKDPAHGGILEFGTELVIASDQARYFSQKIIPVQDTSGD